MSTTTHHSRASVATRAQTTAPDRMPNPASHDQLPSPPDDAELWSYFGRQGRWIQALMMVSFGLAASSMWRFAQTSPWLYPLGALAAINVLAALASAVTGAIGRTTNRAEHEQRLASWEQARLAPPVDVFLPTCGEDALVLRNTYEHVAALNYPGPVRVLVLDDADRAEVRELAADFSFDYLVRPNRGELKKAGNLRYGFDHSDGDYILVLDADFAPRPDMLLHLVPYFDDQSVGIVQSPQYFDTAPTMNWLQRCAGATQELFYRLVQPSRDRFGAAICVGTCALYRRWSLEQIGGFAQIEHSEDVHTGIFLLRSGQRTKYVPIVLAKGLCPDDLAGFLNQQYRWCNGSITLLNSGAAQRYPLTWTQRVSFWAGFLYYISSAINIFVAQVPGVLMVVFFPQGVSPVHFLPFLLGMWMFVAVLPRFFNTRWRLEVLRVQMAYSFCHAVALFDKVTGRTAGWVATGAVGSKNSLSRRIAWTGAVTLVGALGASWVSVAWAIYAYGFQSFWLMLVFLISYTYLAAPLAWAFVRLLLGRRPIPAVSRWGRPETIAARLTWVEVAGYTALIGFLAVLATGAFNSVLPWGGSL